MKKIIFSILIGLLLMQPAFAQLQNADMENWSYVHGGWGLPPYLAVDSFDYWQPDYWTTSNSVTNDPDVGGVALVSQDTVSPHSGTSGIRMYTDSFVLNGGGVNLQLVIPGFLVSGTFPVDLTAFLSNGGSINPISLRGAGQPINNRMASISAYVRFAPVDGDSLLIWAVLKKGNELIAEAKISDTTNYTTYTRVSKNFTYYSCTMPDTAIVFIASSNPDFAALLGGGSPGAHKGTVLEVDSINMPELVGAFAFGPFANHDQVYTTMDVAKTVDVLANDSSCSSNITAVAIVTPPLHGTATVNTDKTINYVPDSAFVGVDSFFYSIYDNSSYDTASVKMSVFTTTGISQALQTSIKVYPNPSNGMVNVELPNNEGNRVAVLDLTGRVLTEQATYTTTATIDLSNYNNGLYFVQVRDKNGSLLATQKVSLQH